MSDAPHIVVLVCGGRFYTNYRLIYDALKRSKRRIRFIIEGGATGADGLAKNAAVLLKIPYVEDRAEWERHGYDAGSLRNAKMLERLRRAEFTHPHQPTLNVGIEVWAFKDAMMGGTANMCEQAARAGVSVKWFSGKTPATKNVVWNNEKHSLEVVNE